MTDDIVTRLRELPNKNYTEHGVVVSLEDCLKIADEIERLQRACDYYQKMCSMIADKNFTANENIERLRNEVKYLNQVADQLEAQLDYWIKYAHRTS